jgi:hypothetical protein
MSVFFSAEEMEGNVWFAADDPAVVARWNVKQIAGSHFDYRSVFHGRSSASADHQADMFDLAKLSAGFQSDMRGPFPPGFVHRAANDHTPQ